MALELAGDIFVKAIARAVSEMLDEKANCTQRVFGFTQAAAFLGLTPEAFEYRIQCGFIPILKLGGRRCFDLRDLQRHRCFYAEDPGLNPDQRILESALFAIRKKPSQSNRFVYFVASGSSVKIGTSKDGPSRIRALQGANPEPLQTLAIIPGDDVLELALHKAFATLRISGEWFRFEGPLKELVEQVRKEQRNGR